LPDNTARQRGYARSFGLDGLFTPQMVVNGVASFSGADRSRAARDVASELAHPAEVRLSIRLRPVADGPVSVDYEAPQAPADSVLVVALLEHSVSADVRAGENAGRRLHHTNVVRAFVAEPAASRGTVRLQAPASMQDGEVVAYLQRRHDGAAGMPVLGATRALLPR
jgi:hypothetical protein